MSPGRCRWLALAGVLAVGLVAGLAFSAYLRPDMVVAFGDLMSFCAALLR